MRKDIVVSKKKRKFTAEHRKNLSLALKGRKLSAEHKKKIGLANSNPTTETRKKLSIASSNPSAETIQKMRESAKRRPPHSAETKKKIGLALSNPSAETKRKLSKASKGENNGNWRGGSADYWHIKAWKLFGKDKCSRCGMTNEEHIKKYKFRLDMHCLGNPKDYSLLEENNWETYCKSCHTIIEERLKNLKLEVGIKLNRRRTEK